MLHTIRKVGGKIIFSSPKMILRLEEGLGSTLLSLGLFLFPQKLTFILTFPNSSLTVTATGMSLSPQMRVSCGDHS